MKKIENSECLNDFGNYIRKAREDRGLLQRQVAEMAEISPNYYSEIENGLRPSLSMVMSIKICQALQIDFNEFVAKYLK